MKGFFCLTAVLTVVLMSWAAICAEEQGNRILAELVYYKKGKPEVIGKHVEDIVFQMESVFVQADDAFLLLVNEDLLKKIKKEGAVEVIYVSPKRLKAGFLDQEMSVSRLLIPIEGRFATPHATVFYANPKYGPTNILVNKKGLPALGRIKSLLK